MYKSYVLMWFSQGRTVLRRWSLVLYGTYDNPNGNFISEASEKYQMSNGSIPLDTIKNTNRIIVKTESNFKNHLANLKPESTTGTSTSMRKPLRQRQRLFKFKPQLKRPKASNNLTLSSLMEVSPPTQTQEQLSPTTNKSVSFLSPFNNSNDGDSSSTLTAPPSQSAYEQTAGFESSTTYSNNGGGETVLNVHVQFFLLVLKS